MVSQVAMGEFTISKIKLQGSVLQERLYFGEERRGSFPTRDFELQLFRSTRHGDMFFGSIFIESRDFNGVDLSGMSANNTNWSFCLLMPMQQISRSFNLKIVGNNLVDSETWEAYPAVGVYPSFSLGDHQLEFGYEQPFPHQPELLYGKSNFQFGEQIVSIGVSGYHKQDYGEDDWQGRFLIGTTLAKDNFLLAAGTAGRLDPIAWNKQTQAWQAGVAWVPYGMLTLDKRPGRSHAFGMFFLGADDVNVFDARLAKRLFNARQRGLIKPSRIVSNQDYDISTNNSHAESNARGYADFGWIKFELPGGVWVEQFQGSVYYSMPKWNKGRFARPFVGVIYYKGDEVVVARGMFSTAYNKVHGLNLGTRFQLHESDDESFEIGYVRFSGTLYAYEALKVFGGEIKLTYWF